MGHVKHAVYLTSVVIFCMFFGCTGLPVVDKTDGALLSLIEAVRKNPQNSERRLELARLYATRYQETKKISFLDAGIKEALEAVRLKPTFSDAHLFLNGALFSKPISSLDKRIIDELKQIQKEALKQDPEMIRVEYFVPYQYFAAFIFYDKGFKEKKYLEMAGNELKEVIRLKPDFHGGHCLLGGVHWLQGKDELALFEAKEAGRLNSECYFHRDLLGRIYTKRAHSEENCYDEEMIHLGIKEFKEAIRLRPDKHYPHSMLGYLYRSKGLYDLSIFELKEALRLGKSAEDHERLGIAFERNGEYDEAIREFYEALVVDSKYRTIHLNLAWTYFLQNRYSDSISEINRYLGPSGGRGRMEGTRRLPLAMSVTLCFYFSVRQNGEVSKSVRLLEDYQNTFRGKKWENRLLQYLLGEATEADVTVETRNRCDRAIVFFFMAYDYFSKGNKEKAVEYFQKTLDTKVFGYGVYSGADAMLKRLK